MRASDLNLLAAPFDTSDVEWKPGAVTRDKSKGLAMAYLTSRAVQDRLDAVCGPADWRNEYRPGPDGGVVCGISIYVDRADGSEPEWVTKWDGADNSDVEAVKGGLSGSMKRAAVVWGIGRSLYSLPAQWVRLDERGRFAEAPRLPRDYTQAKPPTPMRRVEAGAAAAHARPAASAVPVAMGRSPQQEGAIARFEEETKAVGLNGHGCKALLASFGVKRLIDLTPAQLDDAHAQIVDADRVADLNADGFARHAARLVEAAKGRRRPVAAERGRETARGLFSGARLERVLAAIDQAEQGDTTSAAA